MGKLYSEDLRRRVVAAVVTGRLSCNQAAKQFEIGISTAIGWARRLRETGSVAPDKMGGHKPKAISGEHHVWLLQRIKDRDFTLRGLAAAKVSQEASMMNVPAAMRSAGPRRSAIFPAIGAKRIPTTPAIPNSSAVSAPK
jgi:transposase